MAFELDLGRVFRDIVCGRDLQSLLVFRDELTRSSSLESEGTLAVVEPGTVLLHLRTLNAY